MDRVSRPLSLADHLFHLAWKTSSGLVSSNVIGYSSEPVGAWNQWYKPQSLDEKKQHWETFSGRKKSLFLLHIYLYFHILFTYLFVIITTCIWSRGAMEQEMGEEGMLKECHFLLFFFETHLTTRTSSLTQSMIFTVPLNKLQQRFPKI